MTNLLHPIFGEIITSRANGLEETVYSIASYEDGTYLAVDKNGGFVHLCDPGAFGGDYERNFVGRIDPARIEYCKYWLSVYLADASRRIATKL